MATYRISKIFVTATRWAAATSAVCFCLALVTPANAAEPSLAERFSTLERDVKGLRTLRARMGASPRSIRVMAVYSEKAIGSSASTTSQAKLFGHSPQALSSAAVQAGQLLGQQNVRNLQIVDGLPLVTFSATEAQLADIAASGQFAILMEDRLAKAYLVSSGTVMNVSQAHAAGARGTGQAVAILDTGVDTDHPFFSGRVVAGACFSSNFADHGATSLCPGGVTSAATLDSGNHCSGVGGCDHGTHVAGIAAGSASDGITQSGVAPEANVVAVQVFSRFDDQPGGPTSCQDAGTTSPCILSYTSDQIRALNHIRTLSATLPIVSANMSLGGGRFTANCDAGEIAIKDAIDGLQVDGVVTVIAAGNDGFRDAVGAPACVSTAMTVGSTTDGDAISGFSNMSDQVDLLAIGSSIDSSVPGGGVSNFDGTSMAAPQVAGAVAALASLGSGPSVAEIQDALVANGVSVPDGRNGGTITKPRMDLLRAVRALDGGGIAEDCTATFDPSAIRLTNRGIWIWRTWSIAHGDRLLYSFGNQRAEAQSALELIREIGFDQGCYVGRPDSAMHYMKRRDRVPNASAAGQDCIDFDPDQVQASNSDGQWRMVAGSMRMLFFPNEAEARQAVRLVKQHRMQRQCFVGRPDPSFTYWLAR